MNKDKIYPYIKKIEGNSGDKIKAYANGKMKEVEMPWHQVLGNLGVFYVLDDGDSFRYVVSSMVPASDLELIQNQKEIVHKIFVEGDHTLTDQLFYYSIENNSSNNGIN